MAIELNSQRLLRMRNNLGKKADAQNGEALTFIIRCCPYVCRAC